MQLNGQSFEAQALQPFGVELRPTNGERLPVQPWARENIDEVMQAVKHEGLIIIRNATRMPDDDWESIEPSTNRTSTTFPHVDRSQILSQGNPLDAILWTVDAPNRGPTAFVQGIPLRDALLAERGAIDELDLTEHAGSCKQPFLDARASLDGATPAQAVRFQEVVTRVYRGRHYEEIADVRSAPRSSIPLWLRQWFWPTLKPRPMAELLAEKATVEACATAIAHFKERVLRAIQSDVHLHRWTEKPDAAVFAWNNADDPADNGDFVAHFSVADEAMGRQTTLNRARIHQGKIFGETR